MDGSKDAAGGVRECLVEIPFDYDPFKTPIIRRALTNMGSDNAPLTNMMTSLVSIAKLARNGRVVVRLRIHG